MSNAKTVQPGVLQQHQAALAEGRFEIQRCDACHRHVYFPRVGCPHCGATALRWVRASGLGTVHAVTTVPRKPADGGDLGVCLVDLDEGVRLMSRVTNVAPRALRIGQRVRARVEVSETQGQASGLVLFEAIEASDDAAAATGGAA